MKDLDVLVIGRNCIDYISVVDRFPQEDEKVPLNARLVEGGGQGGTASCCVSQLGGKTAVVCNIGDDEEGEFCLGRLRDFQVDTRYVKVMKNAPTPVAYIFVNRSNGKRTILYEPSSLPDIGIPKDLDHLLQSAKTLSLDPQTTTLGKNLKQRIRPDTKLIYDCERWKDHMQEMMAAADYFIPSSAFFDSCTDKFASQQLSDNIFKLKKMIRGQLIVTHGDAGAYYPFENRLYQVPAPPIPVLDTTGAGDNFHGAFALAISRGFDLHKAVRFSVAVASLSCRAYGGRNAVPDFEEALTISESLSSKIV
jgi:sulfofructose kinase